MDTGPSESSTSLGRPRHGTHTGAEPPCDPARRCGRASSRPMTVRVELVLVEGEEGRILRRHQDQAMREVLRWFQEHQTARSPLSGPGEE